MSKMKDAMGHYDDNNDNWFAKYVMTPLFFLAIGYMIYLFITTL